MDSATQTLATPITAEVAFLRPEARRLVAILSADGVGFSRLIEANEDVGRTLLSDGRAVFERLVPQHGGRLFGVFGDSVMAEFPTAGEALRAGVAIQKAIASVNTAWPEATRQNWRIGIHVGELAVTDGDPVGDVVNVAARVQALAEPGGIAVSSAVRDVVRGRLPVALEDIGPQRVKNLATPVHVWRVAGSGRTWARRILTRRNRLTASAAAAVVAVGVSGWMAGEGTGGLHRIAGFAVVAPAALAGPRSVAVMPFEVPGRDELGGMLAESLALDVTADLARFPQLTVIAHESARAADDEKLSAEKAGLKLGVRWLVRGQLVRDGDLLRATVSLVDTADGRQVWSDRIEAQTHGFFDLQDKLVATLASRLPVQLARADLERVTMKPEPNFDAFQRWLQSRKEFERMTAESNKAAQALLEESARLDKAWPRPVGDLGYSYVREWLNGWGDDPEASLRRGVDLVRKAVAMDPDDYENQWSLGLALLAAEDYEGGVEAYRAARKLNPGDAALLADSADALTADGKAEEAVEAARRAIELNPLGPTWYRWNLAYAYLMSRRYDAAIATLEAVPERLNEHVPVLASAYARRGEEKGENDGHADLVRARELMAVFEKEDTEYSLEIAARQPFRRKEDRAFWLEGLKLAGLRARVGEEGYSATP